MRILLLCVLQALGKGEWWGEEEGVRHWGREESGVGPYIGEVGHDKGGGRGLLENETLHILTIASFIYTPL